MVFSFRFSFSRLVFSCYYFFCNPDNPKTQIKNEKHKIKLNKVLNCLKKKIEKI